MHGIDTCFNDKRHNIKSWSSPSTVFFKSKIAEDIYNSYFDECILKKRFIHNDKAKLLFIMGDDAFKKIKQTIKDYLKDNNDEIIIKEDDNFILKDYEDTSNKFIIIVKHPAA